MNNDIRLIAEELDEGENRNMTCPSCNRKGKFSITKENGRVLYHCFRASCELHGGGAFSTTGQRLVRTRPQPRKQKTQEYEGELEYLDDEWVKFLETEIGWTRVHFDVGKPMYSPDYHRVANPIFDPQGRRRGWSLRSYSGGQPKSLTLPEAGQPHLSWYMTHPTHNHAIIVEDIASAVRASVYTNAIALCGTGCGPDYAQEIAAHVRQVTWALDADVPELCMKWHRKYQLLFEDSRVLLITKDLKDMTEEELNECLKETCSRLA